MRYLELITIYTNLRNVDITQNKYFCPASCCKYVDYNIKV